MDLRTALGRLADDELLDQSIIDVPPPQAGLGAVYDQEAMYDIGTRLIRKGGLITSPDADGMFDHVPCCRTSAFDASAHNSPYPIMLAETILYVGQIAGRDLHGDDVTTFVFLQLVRRTDRLDVSPEAYRRSCHWFTITSAEIPGLIAWFDRIP